MRLILETDCGKSVMYFNEWSQIAAYLEKIEKKNLKDWYIEK